MIEFVRLYFTDAPWFIFGTLVFLFLLIGLVLFGKGMGYDKKQK